MIRTWKCLLGAWAVCAIVGQTGYSQDIVIDELGVARVKPSSTTPRPADVLYSDSETVWTSDFQPPPGVGVDPVTVPNDGSVGYAVTSDVSEILYRINRTNRHFHGLDDDGFTSIGAMIPMQVFDGGNALIVADTRAFVSDNGSGGMNLGLSLRRYSPQLRRVFTVSNWLDYDRAGRAGYTQWGLHAASIGQFWSVRGNINTPIGQSNQTFSTQTTPTFVGNNLFLTTTGRREVAYGQADIEVSTPIPYFARYGFEWGLGYYFVHGALSGVEHGHGVSTRVEAQVTEDIWANALVTSDGVFGSNLSLNFEVTLPNGAPSRMMRRLPVKSYLTQSDRRIYRVLRDVSRFTSGDAAVSTRGDFAGDDLRIAHIDPDAGPGGDGSFENPFGSVAEYEALPDARQSQFEIVLVRRRDDGSDTNLDTTVTLFDYQRLLGNGREHVVDTVQGTFVLPSVLDTGDPLLTNGSAPGQSVITLADFNEVSGFIIDGSGGSGSGNDPNAAVAIDGRDLTPFDAGPIGSRGFDINNNIIRNATYGVLIVGETSGPTQTGSITNNTFSGNFLGAADLDYSGSAVASLRIEDNIIFPGLGAFNFLPDSGTLIRSGFDDNILEPNDDLSTPLVPIGFNVNFFGQTESDLFVNNNGNVTFDSALFTFTPFDLLSTSTRIIAAFFADVDTRNHGNPTVYGNDVVNGRNAFGVTWDEVDYFPSNAAHGDQLNTFQLVLIDRSDIAPGDFDIEFNYAQILWETGGASGGSGGLGGSSARVGYSNGVNTQFELPGSGVNGAFLDGGPPATSLVQNSLNSSVLGRYRFAARSGLVNPANQSTGTGLNISLSGNANVTGSIQRNQITGYRTGLAINGPGNSVGLFNVSNNTIQGAGEHGMRFTATDNESLTIFGSRNISRLNGIDGLHMETSGTAVMSVAFENSQFDSNQGRGVKGLSSDDSTLNFSFSSPSAALPRSSASNNGGPGIQFDAVDTATQNIIIDDVFVDPNLDAGILISAAEDSDINVIIRDSEIINTADGPNVDLFGDGIVLRASGNGELDALVADNIITGNVGSGFRARAVENSRITFDLLRNDISGNGSNPNGDTVGIFLERLGNSTLNGNIFDNVVDANVGTGILARVSGGSSSLTPGSTLNIFRNEVTNNIDPDAPVAEGMAFETSGTAILQVNAVGNLIDGNEGNGVRVTTRGGSFFGTPTSVASEIGFASIFDSNIVTNNGDDINLGAGFLFQTFDYSNLVVDVTSIEAAINPSLYQRTLISNNFDGVRIEHRGFANVGDQAVTSVRIGDAFTQPDEDIFSVVIENNQDDGIDIDILNPGGWDQVDTFRPGGIVNLNVSDTLIRGARAAGALDDPGVEILMDGNPEDGDWIAHGAIATLVFGSDISDAAGPNGLPRGPVRDAVGGAFNNLAYARAGVVITDVVGDGMNVVYNDAGGQLNIRMFDSIVGASEFGFNTEDGIDILVRDGAGFDMILDNTQVIGNGGDGVRLRTEAAFDHSGPGEQAFLSGRLVNVFIPNLSDTSNPPDGGDTIFDGPIGPFNDTTSDNFLNSLPFVLDPPSLVGSPQNGWADLESPNDFIADLQIINGSRIDNNGGDGVRLDIGTATKVRASLQNSSFSGNGGYELSVTTFASFETSQQGEEDRGQPDEAFDTVRLDPTAKLDIFFGSLTPGAGPEPGPIVPAEFAAAVGGGGFNTSSSTRVNITYLSTLGNGFQEASTFKGSPRPASLYISALVPNDAPPVDDVDVPLPNRFLNFGQPFDEVRFFTDNVPVGFGFLSKYLNLNTP